MPKASDTSAGRARPDGYAEHFVTEDTAAIPGRVPIPERVPTQSLALFLKYFFHLLPCESFRLHVDYARKLEAAPGGRGGGEVSRF